MHIQNWKFILRKAELPHSAEIGIRNKDSNINFVCPFRGYKFFHLMQIQASVKNIIFDFGAVILNIDHELTQKAFARLGLKDLEKMFSHAAQQQLFDEFEKGRVTVQEFRTSIRAHIDPQVSDIQIDEAWNAMLLDLPEERVYLLDKLKERYRLFLLSNTNEIHFNSFSSYMKQKFKRDIFSEVFEKAYFSHRVNMRKPDVKIFELVLNENGLKKNETLFIDDSLENIEGARKTGIYTLYLEKGKDILSLFH